MARNEHIFERGRGQELSKHFGKENVKKSSQWCILIRKIAGSLAESDELLELLFKSETIALADEYFYISYLFYLNKQSYIHGFHYETVNCTTFEYWDDKEYIFNSKFTSSHPPKWERRLKTFYDISDKELLFLFRAPCLFGRKFSSYCTVNGELSLLEKVCELYDI